MTKKISVLILVDKFDYHGAHISGPVRNYCWLLQGIDRTRFELLIYALRQPGRSAEVFRREGVSVNYLGLSRFNPLTWLAVCKLVLKHKVDILQLQGYGSAFFGQIAGWLTRKPVIVREAWVDTNLSSLQRLFERFLSWNVSRFIAPSKYARRFLQEKKGIPDRKIVCIPNGIPLANFQPQAGKADEMRAVWGVDSNAVVVGIVGMLHANKGHRHLIEAAARLVPRFPKIHYLIVGDGEERARLEKLVCSLGLQAHVIFAGHQTQMPDIYAMMDIYVLASYSETFGNVLLEAMAAGLAIVATRCGGAEQLLRESQTGLFVPTHDSDAMADAIAALIADAPKRKRLARAAVERSKYFDITHTVSKFQNVYEEIYRESFNSSG